MEKPHDPSCAGCQILTLRTAIEDVLAMAATDPEARRILTAALGTAAREVRDAWQNPRTPVDTPRSHR